METAILFWHHHRIRRMLPQPSWPGRAYQRERVRFRNERDQEPVASRVSSGESAGPVQHVAGTDAVGCGILPHVRVACHLHGGAAGSVRDQRLLGECLQPVLRHDLHATHRRTCLGSAGPHQDHDGGSSCFDGGGSDHARRHRTRRELRSLPRTMVGGCDAQLLRRAVVRMVGGILRQQRAIDERVAGIRSCPRHRCGILSRDGHGVVQGRWQVRARHVVHHLWVLVVGGHLHEPLLRWQKSDRGRRRCIDDWQHQSEQQQWHFFSEWDRQWGSGIEQQQQHS
mmetsp:Transcript_10526/g.29019  ORF Transcript_10526/g.29019 Transcript_10526/m.29019 type:complete len:283 (+) Transcript_10526:821-1669(+)